MIDEVWKPIKGYENIYFVSSKGDVMSLAKGKPMCLKQSLNKNGYKYVVLYKEGRWKGKPVHRIVAEEFLDNPEGKACVNHKDYNRKNNNIENLEWCTHKENVCHSKSHMHGTRKCKTNTGEHHISADKKGYFRVSVGGRAGRTIKIFKAIEDAIEYRNNVLVGGR